MAFFASIHATARVQVRAPAEQVYRPIAASAPPMRADDEQISVPLLRVAHDRMRQVVIRSVGLDERRFCAVPERGEDARSKFERHAALLSERTLQHVDGRDVEQMHRAIDHIDRAQLSISSGQLKALAQRPERMGAAVQRENDTRWS